MLINLEYIQINRLFDRIPDHCLRKPHRLSSQTGKSAQPSKSEANLRKFQTL